MCFVSFARLSWPLYVISFNFYSFLCDIFLYSYIVFSIWIKGKIYLSSLRLNKLIYIDLIIICVLIWKICKETFVSYLKLTAGTLKNDIIITNSFMFKVTILNMMNSFKLSVIVISISIILLQFNSTQLCLH